MKLVDYKDTKGFICINNMFISYSSFLKDNDKEYYFNLENARGITKNTLLSILKDYENSHYIANIENTAKLNVYLDLFLRYGFEYTIKEYNDICIVYVYNQKYNVCFKDNFNDLD